MSRPIGAAGIARALNALSYAGPQTSPSSAAGVVARLGRAAAWSGPRLAALTGLPEAEAVAASPVLVVDRHGLSRIVARAMDEAAPLDSLSGARARLAVLRVLGATTTGAWDPSTRSRVLVAPNVLADAHRFSLDQGDWCKWVALRAGLQGVLLERAPFLAGASAGPEALLGRLLLVEGLVDALMRSLTPADLSSVEWLRHHGPDSSLIRVVARLSPFLDPSAAALLEDHRLIGPFASAVVRDGRLEALLSDASALPTREELADPLAWARRAG
ncbi:zinc-dependent metalloprotease [Actinomyces culturomici]|uniref:hypothetical protein n=1 Tax=Actinomyces culturomici TaxID=1926276 RepID=UPI000E1FF78D|nr:hypothetical protein [Actinomyces culturomici]